MFPQLPGNLDMLTSAGVIDFDAESYIKGTPARYWGGPEQHLPLETPLPIMPYRGNTGYNGAPGMPPAILPAQPNKDMYGVDRQNTGQAKTPAWKKVLAGFTAATLVGLGIFKLKGGKLKQLPTQIKNLNFKTIFNKIKTSVQTTYNNVQNWIKGKFKPNHAPTP